MDPSTEPLTLSTMTQLNPIQLQRLEEKYVNRTLKCVPGKFYSLCLMHLSFLLDLDENKLDVLLSKKKKKSSLVRTGLFKKKEKTSADLFGSPLTDEGVCIIIPLIDFLEKDINICKEGIFRKPGNVNRMSTLKEQLIIFGAAIRIDDGIYSSHDVAGVLKEFLRELPEPLLKNRYMEAHRQVTDLGKHASTPEEVARFANKKLSALQLLMMLLPSPNQKLLFHLLRLLNQIADRPETKMTPATLGTIFAPIFFIDRNADASDLYMLISQKSPAVSFMIEKAQELFHAPKELIIDLVYYWNSHAPSCTGTCTDPCEKTNADGERLLNTNVNYTDRELSRSDVPSNTQAELASLLIHVHGLPNTPKNMRLKKKILKSTSTPLSSVRHSERRSLGSSIKKKFPSLGLSKKKLEDDVSSSSSFSGDDNIKTPSMRELLESPAHPTKEKGHQQSSRIKHRFQDTKTKNRENSADCKCSPPKQERKSIETSSGAAFTRTHISVNDEISRKVSLHENSDRSLTPISNTTQIIRASTINPLFRVGLSPKNVFIQLENEITYLPYSTAQKITAPWTPNRNNKQGTKVHPMIPKAQRTAVLPQASLQGAQNSALETSI